MKNVGTCTSYWYLIIHGDVNVTGLEFIFLITPEAWIRICFKHFCDQEFNFIRIYIFTLFFLYLLTNWYLFGADLPANLYPTVGLQTPGEVIDANFGQEPFLFDIEGEMRAIRRKTRSTLL